MQTKVSNEVDGVIAAAMVCANFHGYVDDAWADAVGGRRDGEDDPLDRAASEVRPTIRLSWQTKPEPELDGLVVRLPRAQP